MFKYLIMQLDKTHVSNIQKDAAKNYFGIS